MRVNGGIALIAIGAIIAFAVRDSSSRINFTVVGIIIMLGGALGLWFAYRLAQAKHDEDITLITPKAEEQYTTEPHEYAIEEPIDVTPTHLPKDPTG
jgi:ketopantoate reductase